MEPILKQFRKIIIDRSGERKIKQAWSNVNMWHLEIWAKGVQNSFELFLQLLCKTECFQNKKLKLKYMDAVHRKAYYEQ